MNRKRICEIVSVFIISIFIAVAFSGCALLGASKPFELALQSYADILASGRYEELNPYVTENSYFAKNYASAPEEEKEAVLFAFRQMKIIQINNASQYDNTIHADITFCLPDYLKILESLKKDLSDEIKKSIKNDSREQTIYQQDLIKVLEKGFSAEQTDRIEKTVKMELIKSEHRWKINDDSQLFRGISNDFIHQYTELITSLKEDAEQDTENDFSINDAHTATGGSHYFNKTSRFQLTIHSQTIQLPSVVNKCTSLSFDKSDLSSTLPGNYYDLLPIYVNNEYAGVAYVYNPADTDAKISQCLFGGISLNNTNADPGILLPKGVTFGISPKEARKIYGQPTKIRRSENGSYFTYIYSHDSYQDVELIFSDGKTLTGYRMQFFPLD